MAANNDNPQINQNIAAEEVNPNEDREESIASIYDWIVSERAARKKRKWDTLAKLYSVWKTTMSNSNPKTFLQGRRKKQKHSSLTPMFNCDISYLDEITNNEECSTIKVKIIHIWKTTSTLWGNKIHACANHYVLKLCQPMLKKDNYILLSNFNLYTGLEGMQLTNHVGKIYFKNNTSISVVQDFNCAHDGFEFIEYHDIITDEKYNKLAFDIIGLISSKPKLKAIYYRKKTTIISEFKLQNLNGDEVNVTLWEDNADRLDNYLSQEYIQNEPVVLVIQLAKINTWGTPIDDVDLSTVKHGNACDVTVINISDDEDEVRLDDYFEYDIDGGYTFTTEEIIESNIWNDLGMQKYRKGEIVHRKWVYSVNLHVVTHEQDHSQIKSLVLEGNWYQFGQDCGFEEEKIMRIKLVRYEVQKLNDEILKIPIFHVC
ncbi:replication protein A 70 kDa DNA-binding subunit B [Artemisia annua]|uniref:Replication protein A 70 kDa DNA-binding subunit B n=1 Tax=Artemisia annua TaxID=35608 RepID=A0A2U1LK07_ARTAN|nr:replication protein A 70 kDa DNA-binding subunit B [Artemisia annua]